MINDPLHQRSENELTWFAVDDDRFQQFLRGQRIEPGIRRLYNTVPGRQCAVQCGRTGRSTIGELFIDLWQEDLPLTAPQPVALFMPGQVAHVPANTIHRQETTARLSIGDSFKTA